VQRCSGYDGCISSICEKSFVIPCWIALLHTISASTYFVLIQYVTLISLCLLEILYVERCFQAYYTARKVSTPQVIGLDLTGSAVNDEHVQSSKDTFEVIGTVLFLLSSFTRYVGLGFLLLAVPLAYESVRRKMTSRVIYVMYDKKQQHVDHQMLQFWMQSAGLGSKLIVGVPSARNSDLVQTIRAIHCVDTVIAEAPGKADLMFLERLHIDFVVMNSNQTKFVTDEMISAKRVVVIGEDCVARLVDPKLERKME
jgi:glycerol-3-phosphate cytidylyltransferase-like family protein